MSHIYPKGHYRKLEWDVENIKLLCYGCHFHFWHKEPMLAHDWIKTVLKPSRLEYLKMRSQVNDKTPFDFNLIKLDLEQQISRLRQAKKIKI